MLQSMALILDVSQSQLAVVAPEQEVSQDNEYEESDWLCVDCCESACKHAC